MTRVSATCTLHGASFDNHQKTAVGPDTPMVYERIFGNGSWPSVNFYDCYLLVECSSHTILYYEVVEKGHFTVNVLLLLLVFVSCSEPARTWQHAHLIIISAGRAIFSPHIMTVSLEAVGDVQEARPFSFFCSFVNFITIFSYISSSE